MGGVSGLVLVGWTQPAAFSLELTPGTLYSRPPPPPLLVDGKDGDGGLGWKGGTARGGPGARHNAAGRGVGSLGASGGGGSVAAPLGSGRWPGVPGRSPPPVRGAPPRPAGPQPFPTPRVGGIGIGTHAEEVADHRGEFIRRSRLARGCWLSVPPSRGGGGAISASGHELLMNKRGFSRLLSPHSRPPESPA